MLLEPGPIPLFLETQIPQIGARGTFERFVARDVALHDAAAQQLGLAASRLAPAVGAPADLAAASDLAAAAVEHDRQSRGADSTIGAVAADAGTLEGVLAGLTNELGRELQNAAPPREPPPPDDQPNEDWKDPEFAAIVREYYQKFLDREPSDDEIESHRGNPAGFAGILAAIFASEEYQQRQAARAAALVVVPATPAPIIIRPAGPGDGGPGGGEGGEGGGGSDRERVERLVDLYAQQNPNEAAWIDRFVADNDGDKHRAPEALELPGWKEFVGRNT